MPMMSSSYTHYTHAPQGQLRACEECGVTSVKEAGLKLACGKCKYVYYCSRECQVIKTKITDDHLKMIPNYFSTDQ